MIFAIPRGNATYVGTTDTNYTGELENPAVTEQDADYILAATNAMFQGINLTRNDIASSWCGLRPLIHEDGKSPSELSRKDEIFISDSGVISIAGGKLTGYRKMAEKTVNIVVKQLSEHSNKHLSSCNTDRIVLSGGNFNSPKAIAGFIRSLNHLAQVVNCSEEQTQQLVYKYGTNTSLILEKAKELSSVEEAEIWYSVNHEMTTSLSDFLIRRTGKLYFERPQIAANYTETAKQLALQLCLGETTAAKSLKDFEKDFQQVLEFRS